MCPGNPKVHELSNTAMHCDSLSITTINVSIPFRMKFPDHAIFMLMLQLVAYFGKMIVCLYILIGYFFLRSTGDTHGRIKEHRAFYRPYYVLMKEREGGL